MLPLFMVKGTFISMQALWCTFTTVHWSGIFLVKGTFISMQALWFTFTKVHWSGISWIVSDLLDRQSTNELI